MTINQSAVVVDTMVVSALVNAHRQPEHAATFRERIAQRQVVAQPDDQLIVAYAALRAASERIGHAISQKIHEADRWIAATAIRLDIELVTDDSVFTGAPKLALTPPVR